MNSHLESVPTHWTSADDNFFCLVSHVFDPDFLYGSGVLLASYDSGEPADSPTPVATGRTEPCETRPTRARQH